MKTIEEMKKTIANQHKIIVGLKALQAMHDDEIKELTDENKRLINIIDELNAVIYNMGQRGDFD